MHKKIFSFTTFFLLLISFYLGWSVANYYNNPTDEVAVEKNPHTDISFVNREKENADLSTFWKVWEVLDDDYLHTEALDTQERVYGAIKGMVNALDDPYTVYMDPDDTEEFQKSLNGELEGIGAELTVKEGVLIIVSPLKDSPAEKAGLRPGDIIYKIEEELAAEMTIFDAIMKIRGPKGTNVNLTIIRDGLDEPLEVTITRAKIVVESVTFELKENNIAYIEVNQFGDNTMDEFNKIIGDVLLSEPKGIILDLRYNGGGYLDIAVDILSELLEDKKEAVVIRQRDSDKNESMFTPGDGRLVDLPLVVLVNEGSASASEIVAGAIQDHERGIVIGVQTFGKGSVQEVVPLDDDSSLRLTVAEWLTPSERSIEEVGITPDIIVEITDEQYLSDEDPQLEEALEWFEGE